MPGVYVLSNRGFSVANRTQRKMNPTGRGTRHLLVGVRRVHPRRSHRFVPQEIEKNYDQIYTHFVRGMARLVYVEYGGLQQEVDLLVTPKDQLPHLSGRPVPKPPPKVVSKPKVEPEPEPEPEPVLARAGHPSKQEIDEALKAQLVEWCDQFGLDVPGGSYKAAYHGALMDHLYPKE